MIKRTTPILLLLMSFLTIGVKAQQNWKIISYNAGYRIFEFDAVGNNPSTVASLLKEPAAYNKYVSTITYNLLYGNPEVLTVHTLYVNAEWHKDNALSRFWKNYTIQAGLLLAARIRQDAGAIGNEGFDSAGTVLHKDLYILTKNQQFFGANVGLNRRFTISNKLKFLTGLHAQGSLAVVHHYEQKLDSSTFTPVDGWRTKTTRLSNLKGKNFFQWQLMLPLGLEYEVNNRVYIRLEVDAGIVGSRFRPSNLAAKEAHGAGIWLIYKPKKNR